MRHAPVDPALFTANRCRLVALLPRALAVQFISPESFSLHLASGSELFRALMKDEEGHIDFLETQLDIIGRSGIELYTQKHMGGLDEGH